MENIFIFLFSSLFYFIFLVKPKTTTTETFDRPSSEASRRRSSPARVPSTLDYQDLSNQDDDDDHISNIENSNDDADDVLLSELKDSNGRMIMQISSFLHVPIGRGTVIAIKYYHRL